MSGRLLARVFGVDIECACLCTQVVECDREFLERFAGEGAFSLRHTGNVAVEK